MFSHVYLLFMTSPGCLFPRTYVYHSFCAPILAKVKVTGSYGLSPPPCTLFEDKKRDKTRNKLFFFQISIDIAIILLL